MEYNDQKLSKITVINDQELNSLLRHNPNTLFYFFTYYCYPCYKKISNASNIDSISGSKIIYINLDNKFALKNVSNTINQNRHIGLIYHISDASYSGMYHVKGKQILEKYAPFYKGRNAYPFTFKTNNSGQVIACY
jgi:hypothetical protein